MKPFLLASTFFALPLAALAGDAHQPYKGYEDRKISSLSESDIEQLKDGAGWGLALPAELNGYPGPAHVLELAVELALSQSQMDTIQALFDDMQKDAVAAGLQLIAAEAALDAGFKAGNLDAYSLKSLVSNAEHARTQLRFIHLSRHLKTVDILLPDQTETYSILRGYSSDPCKNVPEGHNRDMWLTHNGCTN